MNNKRVSLSKTLVIGIIILFIGMSVVSSTGNIGKGSFIYKSNNPPNTPEALFPFNGSSNIPIDANLIWSGDDPDGDNLTFDVYFGTCSLPPKVESNQSNTSYNPGILDFETKYYWKIVAWDEHGASTTGPIWWFTTDPGCKLPPDTPEIEGKRRFKEGEGRKYPYYKINSTDPDGDDICYLINWSDGTQEWTGYYASGEEISINVTIPLEKGTYVLFKIKAKDVFGLESDWAILEVTVPRNRATIYSLFHLFFERFPLLEVFLRAMNLLR